MALPIASVYADLPDPRADTANKLHALVDIVTIAVCATIGGANGWEQIAEYGRRKEAFFRQFLTLENGIPSHDTFYRVFSLLDPAAFAKRFALWMASACEATGLIPIAIDGKSARRAKRSNATGCLHVVSAWVTTNHLTLGQVVVPDGTNEIGVIPELLQTLDLAGAIVTIDAAGCQIENAKLIRKGEGHYLLTVKGNQPTLHEAVQTVFERADETGSEGVRFDHHATVEEGHGRQEERSVCVMYEPKGLPSDWLDVAAVVSVLRDRMVKGKVTTTVHYYLTSYAGTAKEIAELIRGHWEIENGLHWILDVAFREDENRTRDFNAGANLALLRRVAVSLLKRVKAKGSIETRRLIAAWDDEFLLQVLQGIQVDQSA
ncbi:MAG: ISAs1 family transposase [Planctomycetes bacterium]|nr:ISAs1 family transposase [Planctomycetota bacterium]